MDIGAANGDHRRWQTRVVRVDSWNPVVGESFGQEERLTVRLRGLIRSYPRSVGIIKEFLQNADDAGATWLRVIWDEREHPREALPDPRMAALQGPALLFVNDQVFSAADFDAIRRIGESSKSDQGPKTGRFGLGFNTAYNVTDFPSFVSGNWAIAFDPHRRSVGSEAEGTGKRWELADLWQFAPDWLQGFTAGGLVQGSASHPATIFRLPIRDAEAARSSEICDEPFERQHFDQMLKDLWEAGDELLLFARNVLELRIELVTAAGEHQELLRLATQDPERVRAHREIGNRAVEGDIAENIVAWRVAHDELPRTTYRQTIAAVSPKKTELRPWQVAAGLFADGHGELLGLNEAMIRLREKAIPWAGAAIRLELRDDGSLAVAHQRGKLFCTFPLPDQLEALPCHLNGCFDLDSSRRQISIDASVYAEADRVRVAWNVALLRHALPQAAALAIAALVPEVATPSPGAFYALWPDLGRSDEPWETLFAGIFGALARLPIIRTRAHHEFAWETLLGARLPPPLWGEDLREALRDDGMRLPDPDVPVRLVRGADVAMIRTARHKPQELRDWLRLEDPLGVPLEQAPRACLRERSHVFDLLQFCLSDRKDDIAGLPLALTADGQLRTFGKAGELFLADDLTRQIFVEDTAWFIDAGVQSNTRLQPCEAALLREMAPERVVARLAGRLCLEPGDTLPWTPAGPAIPNATWLVLVLRYLAERVPPAQSATLAGLALFPDPQERLHCAAGGVLLIPADDLERPLRDALGAVGVDLVAGGYDVVEAVRVFQQRHPGPISALTGPSLARRLTGLWPRLAALPAGSSERAALLDYFAAPRWLDHYGPDELSALRGAPLLRTLEGGVVCADTPGVYLPGGFRPPSLVDAVVELVDAGPGGRWRALLDKLGVGEMRCNRYLADVLIPTYPTLAPEMQRAALMWLRDDVDLRAIEIEEPALCEQLRRAPLIRARSGEMHPAAQLHDGDDEGSAGPLIERRARTPDMEFYRGDPERWRVFFTWLGLRRDPPPETLLADIDALLAHLEQDAAAARSGLAELFVHIHGRWSGLGASTLLIEGLQRRAWLPAVTASAAAGFVAPEDRLYRPEELYLPEQLERIASQGPVFAATLPALDPELTAALGFRVPETAAIVAHLDLLRELWQGAEHGGLAPAAVTAATAAIYAELGRPERDVPEDMLQELAMRRCVWDAARLRFWLPAHAFAVPIADLFGELRGHVPGDTDEVRRGLTRIGRRPGADATDIVATLESIDAAQRAIGGGPLEEVELQLALRLLRRLQDLALPEDARARLLVPTQAGDLRPLAQVRVDDAPWFSARIHSDALAVVHPRIALELIDRLGVRRLSTTTREQLAGRPALSGNVDKQHFCRQLTATIHHPAFAAGVARILAQQGAVAGAGLALLAELRVVASDRLVTHLRVEGVAEPLGAEEVAVFADEEQRAVYVSGDHWDSVVVQICEAINRLVDSALRDLSHLEAILRIGPDDIVALLDHRRVPRLHTAEVPEPTRAAAAPAVDAPPPATVLSGLAHERMARVEAATPAATPEPDVIAAAVARVVASEREAGRQPKATDARHPAYDVQSGELGDPAARFIRVIGIDGAWDRIPVVLGANYYSAARTFGRNFWLYVVEHALDPARARIHRVHDPVSRVARFVFDHRWSAQGERTAADMSRHVGWYHVPPTGERGLIEAVEPVGMFIWLRVRLADGRPERRFYKPGLDGLLPPETGEEPSAARNHPPPGGEG
jgi:sacsin